MSASGDAARGTGPDGVVHPMDSQVDVPGTAVGLLVRWSQKGSRCSVEFWRRASYNPNSALAPCHGWSIQAWWTTVK